jgi:hypothetical protein
MVFSPAGVQLHRSGATQVGQLSSAFVSWLLFFGLTTTDLGFRGLFYFGRMQQINQTPTEFIE